MKHRLTQLFRAVMILGAVILSTQAIAQRTVRGTIVNATDNSPIVGASIQVKGTNTGAVSGPDGGFSIQVPNDQAVLVVSFIGFNSQQVPVDGHSTLTIKLQESASQLNEVVVMGYTAQQKKDITGSVSIVNVDNLKQVPAGTLESQLQGMAAGVTVINSGAPGGGSNFRIRGITSLGNTDPLIIVDGVQVGSMQDINPYDIESIQVLKDAGAAAIYGVRGSNGVVIITTKKGKAGVTKVNYDGYIGTQRPLSGNVWNIATPQEEANLIWQSYKNDGIAPSHPQYGNGPTPVLPDYIIPTGAKEGDPGTSPSDYVFDPGQPDDNRITRANKAGTDWFHAIFKPALQMQHSISASGGNDKSNYLFSLEYLNQEGTLIYTYLKRYGVRMNSNFKVGDHIRVGENAYVYYKQNPGFTNQNEGNAISFSYREPPIIPIYDIMGNFAGTGAKGLSNAQNPYANQYRTKDNKSNDWAVLGNVYAEVDFLKHFTARTQFGGNYDNYYYYYFTYTAYENAEGATNPNSYTEGAGYNSSWTWTNTLRYNQQFGNHNVALLVGSEAVNNFGRSMVGSRTNYVITDPTYWELNTGSGAVSNNGSVYTNNTLFSLFGRLDYSYKDKYLLAATLRRDGSSMLAPQSRYGYFPSVSLAWRISQESFMKNITWINDLKLRGGWGKLGSLNNINPTNAYTLYAQLSSRSYYDLNGTGTSSLLGWYNSQLGNPNAKWEGDILTNIGFDATVLGDRLDVSLDWYKKAINGLLFPVSLPATAGGAAAPFVNLGNIQNTGIDFSGTYHARISSEFNLDLTGTLTSYNNKIVKLPFQYQDYYSAGSTRIGAFTRAQVGHPIGAFFGYKVIGYFQDANDVAKSPTQTGAAPGFFKYLDANGDGKITDADRVFFGNPNPKFTYGLNVAATYKHFDLSAFFYGVYGNDVINYVKYWLDFWQVFEGAVSKDAVYNSWSPNNPNPKTPILTTKANFSNTTVFNSWYMEKGSYFRCKQLQIGYTIPSARLSKIGIDRLRIYVQAVNLFTITKYSGLDPELQGSNLSDNTNFGIDLGNYPDNQKAYFVGVNLSF